MVRVLKNGLVLTIECLAIAGAAWAAVFNPLVFACVTGVLTLALGIALEYPRLAHEVGFYFSQPLTHRSIPLALYAGAGALLKGLFATFAAVLTFCGTDQERLWIVSLLFAATLCVGTNLLRWLRLTFDAHASRWGYFQLAVFLGMTFSAGLQILVSLKVIETPSLTNLAQSALFETAPQPTIEQVSELLFKLKQYFDAAITSFVSLWTGPDIAQFLSVILSVNMLTGFVAAIYAVLIAKLAEILDNALGDR